MVLPRRREVAASCRYARRRVRVRVGSAIAVVLVAAGCVAALATRDGARPSASTLRMTFGDPAHRGVLRSTRGEPLIDRTPLAPRSPATKQLALFAQITDAHVMDEESP